MAAQPHLALASARSVKAIPAHRHNLFRPELARVLENGVAVAIQMFSRAVFPEKLPHKQARWPRAGLFFGKTFLSLWWN